MDWPAIEEILGEIFRPAKDGSITPGMYKSRFPGDKVNYVHYGKTIYNQEGKGTFDLTKINLDGRFSVEELMFFLALMVPNLPAVRSEQMVTSFFRKFFD